MAKSMRPLLREAAAEAKAKAGAAAAAAEEEEVLVWNSGCWRQNGITQKKKHLSEFDIDHL